MSTEWRAAWLRSYKHDARWNCRIGVVRPKPVQGNVYAFPGTPAPDLPAERQPDPGVIRLLGDALDRARRGEVQAAAMVLIDETGWPCRNWASGHRKWPVSLITGALGELSHDMQEAAT